MLRATCVPPVSHSAAIETTDGHSTAPLSPVNRWNWARQVQDDERLGLVAIAVAFALARFHNSTNGLTCPSVRTIMAKAHAKERAVRDAIKELIASGHLLARRRGPTSSNYTLVLKAAPDAGHDGAEAAPATPTATRERHGMTQERHLMPQRPAPHAAKQGREQISTNRTDGLDVLRDVGEEVRPDVGRAAGSDARSDARREGALADLETERLARRVQRASDRPWRLDNARRDVVDAVTAVGVEKVRAFADGQRDASAPPWELRRRLAALGAGSVNADDPAPGNTPAPSDALDTAGMSEPMRTALRLLSQADTSTRLRWHRQSGSPAQLRHLTAWAPSIALEFLAEEHPSVHATLCRGAA